MGKKYFWLQLKDDFFYQKEIKKIRKIAGGDTYTIIYLKMLLLSLKNDGKLYFDGIEEDFVEEISLEIDEEVDNVKIVVMFLIKNKLMEVLSDDEYYMSAVPELIGKESDSAARVRKYREKKKLLEAEKKKALQCNECNVTSNECNNLCNTEIEIKKEKEIEKKIEIESESNKKKEVVKINFDEIMQAFNTICVNLPKIKSITDKRKNTLKKWINDEKDLDLLLFFNKVNDSDYLSGRVKSWRADFDWIIKKENRIKIQEGRYDNWEATEARKQSPIDILGELYQEAGKREGIK